MVWLSSYEIIDEDIRIDIELLWDRIGKSMLTCCHG
jgi:hypothetical protein